MPGTGWLCSEWAKVMPCWPGPSVVLRSCRTATSCTNHNHDIGFLYQMSKLHYPPPAFILCSTQLRDESLYHISQSGDTSALLSPHSMCLEVLAPSLVTAAHLGDGGEGLLVLRPGDGQQRVGHRDQACSGHCVVYVTLLSAKQTCRS